MASIQTHTIIQLRLPFFLMLISGIRQPSVTLHEYSRAEVLLRVPPVWGAGGRTAGAENALIKTVQLLTFLLWLAVFFPVGRWSILLEVGLDGFILLVELGQVGDDVLDDVGVGQRVDFAFCLGVGWDTAWMRQFSICPKLFVAINWTYTNMQECWHHQCS